MKKKQLWVLGEARLESVRPADRKGTRQAGRLEAHKHEL